MKAQKILLMIFFNLLILSHITAQKKIGVFIHGFQGGPEKWTQESKVPSEWTSGSQAILDESVVLSYNTEDLQTESSREQLLGKFITEMKKKGNPSKDQWILIGHSLGGLVARDLYPHLKRNDFDIIFNIVAIISIGGPSQGAMAADVDTTYIFERLKSMEQRIEDAYAKRIIALDFAVDIIDLVEGKNLSTQIASIPFYIKTVRDSALGYAKGMVEDNVNSLIGPTGDVIQRINTYNKNNYQLHPPNYLSVIGAEKNKAPIRMAGHIFGGDPDLKDEVKMLKQINNLRNKYFQLHEDLYHASFQFNYSRNLSCRASLNWFDLFNKCQPYEDAFKRDRKYRELWKSAKNEIDQIDNIWADLINAYRFETISYRTFIPPCQDRAFSDQLVIKLPDDDCSENPNGEFVYISNQIKVPDKHDGVVTTNSVLWTKSDNFDDSHNIYMKDVNITPRGDDGGYNHFELRNFERAYTLKENGQVVFSIGDENESMKEAKEWLQQVLLNL